MSGFVGATGFAAPDSIPGFLGLLQIASFRGVPFKVIASAVKKGRRQAIHEYPFRDGGWPEDMGRAMRVYQFSGYLIGDLAPAIQLALDTMLEMEGPGLLIHPTIGAVQVAVLSATTAVHVDRMRVIEVQFEFIEASPELFPIALIATGVSVLLAASSALTACNTDLGGTVGPVALAGTPITTEAAAVVTSFAAAATIGGSDPTGIVRMATALPPPDANTTYGRYAAGSATTSLPIGTTVATLQAQLANQRAALAVASVSAVAAAGSYSAATDMMGALATVTEAARAGLTDPADQVRVMLSLAVFSYSDTVTASTGIGADQVVMRAAMTLACQQAAVISLARAAAAYQPASYDDAAALRVSLAAALDVQITAAGDLGNDASYVALKQLRSAVVRDLTVRGASLPSVVTVNLPINMPSLAIAQRLYQDASRSDQIAAEANVINPAFCPLSFQVLSR